MFVYQLVYIIPSTFKQDEIQTIQAEVKAVLAQHGAEITHERIIGNKRLGYVIKQQTNGFYVVLEYSAPPASLPAIGKALDLFQKVLRYQLVKVQAKTEEARAAETQKHERIKQFFRDRKNARKTALSSKGPAPRPKPAVRMQEPLIASTQKSEASDLEKPSPPPVHLSEQDLDKKLDEILEQDISL